MAAKKKGIEPRDIATDNFVCGYCKLSTLKTKFVFPAGNKNAKILIVTESPGREEDYSGVPGTGPSGGILRETLSAAGIDPNDTLLHCVTMCKTPLGRPPTKEEYSGCYPYTLGLIKSMPNLRLVILLGAQALEGVLKLKRILDKRGSIIKKDDIVYLPTLNPLSTGKNLALKNLLHKDFELARNIIEDNIKRGEYHCVKDEAAYRNVLEKIDQHEVIAVDIETSASVGEKKSDFTKDSIIGVSLAFKEYEGYYIPFHAGGEDLYPMEEIKAKGKELFTKLTAPGKKLVLHNGKFDANFIRKYFGVDICKTYTYNGKLRSPYFFDTKLASHLLDCNVPHRLKMLLRQYPDMAFYEQELDAYKKKHKVKNYGLIPLDIMEKYAAGDADGTLRLYNKFIIDLKTEEQEGLFYGMVMPLNNVLADTQYHGVKLDKDVLHIQDVALRKELEKVKSKIYKLAGEKFNIGSRIKLAEILFTKLKIQTPTLRTKKKAISTSEEALQEVKGAHPIIELIIQFFELTKLHSSFIVKNLKRTENESFIHTTYNLHGTVSGRLCVAGDTVLNTDRGDFEISSKSWNEGSKCAILTHEGRRMPILRRFYKGEERMFKVTLSTGRSIKCTAGHRVLTPAGWRHLHELKEGDEVCTYDNTFGKTHKARKMGSVRRTKFLPHFYGRENDPGRCKKHVRSILESAAQHLGLLGKKVWCRVKSVGTPPLLQCSSRKYEWGKRASGSSFRQEEITKSSILRVSHSSIGKEVWSQRIPYKEKHGISQHPAGKATSKQNAVDRHFLSGAVRALCSWFSGYSTELLRRSNYVLRQIIHFLSEVGSNGLVYSASSGRTSELSRAQQDTKKSYSLEFQQIRDAHVAASTGLGDRTYQAILYFTREAGRFLHTLREYDSRVGWWVSQVRRKDKKVRQSKKQRDSVKKDSVAACSGGEVLEGPKQVCFSNKTAHITKIEDVGILGVWDIEVAGDHSYCAHGFINHNSSSAPNLQQIPGNEDFRKMFIAREGHSFIISDYSQIELRVMAVFSRDPGLLGVFERGEDVHAAVARKILNKRPEDPLEDYERKIAKTINFGLIYGMSSFALAKGIGKTEPEAQHFLTTFFDRFRKVLDYQNNIRKYAAQAGYVTTLLGRRRRLPDITSRIDSFRERAERQALNSGIQGTAGECTNMATIKLYYAYKNAGIPARLVLTVHDELVAEVPNDRVAEATKITYNVMRATAEQLLGINVEVDQSINSCWVELKKRPAEGAKPGKVYQEDYLDKLGLTHTIFSDIISEYNSNKVAIRDQSNDLIGQERSMK